MVDLSQLKWATVPQADFSTLGNLQRDFIAARREGNRDRVLADIDVNNPQSLATLGMRLLKAGDVQGGMAAAQLSRQNSNDDWQRQYQGGMLDVARQRATKENQPAIVQQAVAGGLKPGTPEYNEYILRSGRPPQTAKPLAQNTVNALGEAGEQVTTFDRLVNTWNPAFGGKGAAFIGEAQNWAGRNLPGVTENLRNNADQAAWWQDYQGQKNLIRNKLFGSALTATEKGEFEKAAINPGMQPGQITKNLERQQAASKRAATKLASYYVKAGYQPDQIEAAIGVPLADLGINVGGPKPAAGGGQAGGPVRIGSPQERDALQPGTQYIAPDGSLRTKQ